MNCMLPVEGAAMDILIIEPFLSYPPILFVPPWISFEINILCSCQLTAEVA